MTDARLLIRPALAEDACALHELSRAVVRAGEGVVLTPEDVEDRGPTEPDATSSDGAAFVARWHDSPALVGEANIRRLRPGLLRHVAVLALAVHPAHQRRGVGRALLQQLLAWAREHHVERVELYTRADNHRARALYESFGFETEAVRERFIRLGPGKYVDDVVMRLFL